MKKLTITVIVLCISSIALLCAQQKTNNEQFKASYNNSKTLVQSQQYSFVAEVVYRHKNRALLDSEINTFKINKSNISGQLKSLSADSKPLVLDGTLKDYKTSYNDDKQRITISFKINGINVLIEVKANGKAFLTVHSGSYSNISWTGHLK